MPASKFDVEFPSAVARLVDLTDLLPLVRAYYRFDGIRFRKDTATAIGRLIA